ncbi:hypothetical protein C9374_006218 [Naegleria lovaniensis]|uniref:Uncharacterized protein n=1 Tax=Naegleria lovaniensis TaxID=51637 RepID=A0AA88GMR5_NAELO|nr:uncharacterized protein C9374_006218 [Naegleria lovaniensis]KAG2381834.1 hypothetical protein C9374_006218 [Naegleria lovaniensis]
MVQPQHSLLSEAMNKTTTSNDQDHENNNKIQTTTTNHEDTGSDHSGAQVADHSAPSEILSTNADRCVASTTVVDENNQPLSRKKAFTKRFHQDRRPSIKSPNIAKDEKDVGSMLISPLTSHTFPYLFSAPESFVSEHVQAIGTEDFKRRTEDENVSSDDNETTSDVDKRDSIEFQKDENEQLQNQVETPLTEVSEKTEEINRKLYCQKSPRQNLKREEDKGEEAFWIDCQQCSPEEVNELQKYFRFHPLTAEDCINNDSGEKWEVFDNYLFFSITGQIADKAAMNEYLPCYLNILIFDNCVVTIHDKPIEGMNLLMNRIEKEFEFDRKYNQKIRAKQSFREQQEVIEEIHSTLENTEKKQAQPLSMAGTSESTPLRLKKGRAKKSTYIISPSWVFYAYLDAIIDVYIPKVDNLIRECDTLDEFTVSLNTSEKEDLLWRIALNKRRTAELRKLLLPKQKMITYLVSSRVEIPFMDRDVQLFLRDVLDHLMYCCDRLEIARDSLNQSHTNYLTRVQIEIAQNSQKTDAFMNRITVFASIFGPLSVLSGIWGMNVKVPGQGEDNLYWFFGLCSFMAIIVITMIILLRKQLVNM